MLRSEVGQCSNTHLDKAWGEGGTSERTLPPLETLPLTCWFLADGFCSTAGTGVLVVGHVRDIASGHTRGGGRRGEEMSQ